MKHFFLITLSLFILSVSAQKENYIINIEKDTVFCEKIESGCSKCINGKTTTKFKEQDVLQYKIGDTTYYAITGFKKKNHIHGALLMTNEKYKILQYDYLESATSGPSIPRTKLLITDSKYTFITELALNETTSTTLKKYFNQCEVFNDELKKFKSSSQSKRFPISDFNHLVNVYSNSCQ